jgi:HEAT repeat protein
MKKTHKKLLALVWGIILIDCTAVAQVASKADDLLRQLGSPETSARAAESLIRLGSSDQTARAYISLRIPALIYSDPDVNFSEWSNAVRIAGELKIAQASKALGTWVGDRRLWPPETELSDGYTLRNDPAAKALSQIGNPAIPTLVVVLNGNVRARRSAVRALEIIGTARAIAALRKHEPLEKDDDLKSYIDDVLAAHDK